MPLWQAAAALRIATRERRARGLAQPHAEIEQRPLADRLEQPPMAGLGRDVRDQAMVERARVGGEQHRGGGGAGVAVEQHRDAAHAGGQDRAGDGGELAPAEPAQQLERVARRRSRWRASAASMTGDLARRAPRRATPVPGPAQSARVPPNSAGAQRRRRRWCWRCPSRRGTARRCRARPPSCRRPSPLAQSASLIAGASGEVAGRLVEVQLVDPQIGVDDAGRAG